MRAQTRIVMIAALTAIPCQLLAQDEQTVRTQLQARGLPPALVDEVSTAAADATAQGLPPDMLVDKAVEGWAKGVPQARIMAVADIVDAMTSDRSYRPAKGLENAVEEITRNKGTLYDPKVVEATVKVINSKGYPFK